MEKVYIAPSALSADFGRAAEQFKLLEESGIKYLHLDVMDGIFVPNISFGQVVIKSLRPHTHMVFDVHLMITEPIRYIKQFAQSGADYITVHYEACKDLKAQHSIASAENYLRRNYYWLVVSKMS